MADWCKTIGELDDFLAFVVLYGPDRFPPQREMNIEKAFAQINAGINNSAGEIASAAKVDELKALSRRAEDKFGSGRVVQAAHLLQEMSELLNSS